MAQEYLALCIDQLVWPFGGLRRAANITAHEANADNAIEERRTEYQKHALDHEQELKRRDAADEDAHRERERRKAAAALERPASPARDPPTP